MPQSTISSSYSSTSSSSPYTSRLRSSSISSTCSSGSFSSTWSSNSSYSLSSYGSSIKSPSEGSDTSTSSSTSLQLSRHTRRVDPISSLFAGLTFFFDKESFKSLNEKQKMMSLVKDHCGSASLMLSKKTTHFIIDWPTSLLLSLANNLPSVPSSLSHSLSHSLLYQLNTAVRLSIPVATFDFIFSSIPQLTLATQHVATLSTFIKVAPEIPLLAYLDDHYPAGDSATSAIIDLQTAVEEVLIFEGKNDDEESRAAKEEGQHVPVLDDRPLETLAYAPTVLSSSIPPTRFSPTSVFEKNKACRLMSLVESTTSESAAAATTTTTPPLISYSFEESRYYRAIRSNGEICLAMPARPVSKLGSLWAWGGGAKGQLGGGDKQQKWKPEFVDTDFSSAMTQVDCGDAHTAAVTAIGDVWTWGTGASGCLGHGEFKGSTDPVLVDSFMDIKINMVACGKSHTAALTDVGTIFTWGSNHAAQLGYPGIDKCSEPKEVFSIKDAVFVACGGNNTAVLTKYGDLYTMGCNEYGQRGIGKRIKHRVFIPSRVQFPDETKIKYTSVGQGFMGALSIDGEALYTWGRNSECQCGNGSAKDVFSPQKIASAPIIHFACGDTHASYVTVRGDVFTWGWGPVGQLGHPPATPTCTTPVQVEGVHSARMVACGARHTVAVVGDRGKIWTWGANELGQIGIPAFDSYYQEDEDEVEDGDEDEDEDSAYAGSEGSSLTWLSPQMIETMSRVSMVACGKDHTLAIIEESHVPIQFARDGNDEALCYWLENNPKMRDLDNASLKTELGSIRDDELGTDYSLLHWATYFANEDVLELLAGQWMDPNVIDCNGDTPLHICAERDIPFCVQILLQNGGKPDLKNKTGKTAIHISVENHTIDVLREMVENSISDKSVVDGVGNTPLHYAIQLRHFDMAKYLIESAAQPQILDKAGKTALDYCTIKEASHFKSIAQKNDVFISYAHVDLTFALKIKEFLESYAIKCWMDMTRLEAGSDWRLDIGNGLLSSKLVLYVASRASVVSDWCIKELHMAKRHNLVIIPVWFQKVDFDSEVNSLIFGRGFLDFSDPKHFVSRGKRLSKKLKHVLGIIKQSKPNPYLEIPVLTTEQLWKQLFLTILIQSHSCMDAAGTLEGVLHSSAIFSCTHNISLPSNSPYVVARQANLDHTWGIVFLINSLKQVSQDIEQWWKYAEDRGKRVYLCMVHGDATHVKNEDLPAQALKQTSVPIFYLESVTSLQQLVFFVHLAQREEFMAKQVGVMQGRLTTAETTIRDNQQELLALRKRFYVE